MLSGSFSTMPFADLLQWLSDSRRSGTLELAVAAAPSRQAAWDFVTRDLFSQILEGEEEHVDFIETQLELIEKMGVENYIQLQSQPAGKE